jgi:ATP-dependent Clp protease protease subunit
MSKKSTEFNMDDCDPERTVFIFGDISWKNITDIIAAMLKMVTESYDPITIVINSEGGESSAMFALYDIMRACSCPIRTIGIGDVMSACILILAAGTKGHRFIGPCATIMTHKISAEINGGSIKYIETELSMYKRQERLWVNAMSKLTGQSINVMQQLNDHECDVYITPAQCIELGIADILLYSDGQTNAEEPYT